MGSVTLVPDYLPRDTNLPTSLRHSTEPFAFHFTEPDRARAIVLDGVHAASTITKTSWGIYLTKHGPHLDTAADLRERIFAGNVMASPRLWAAIVYRISPHRLGLACRPDPNPGQEWALVADCPKRGLRTVHDHLLAWGVAVQPDGKEWMWWEP